MNILEWLGRLIDRLEPDHAARAAQKARLGSVGIGEEDVTPYEMRIANMKHDANELLTAAAHGELNDWATEQLGLIAETSVNAWRYAVHAMVERMTQDDAP